MHKCCDCGEIFDGDFCPECGSEDFERLCVSCGDTDANDGICDICLNHYATDYELLEKASDECKSETISAPALIADVLSAEKAKIELKAVCCAPDENHNIAACDNDIIPVLEKAIDLMSEQKIYKISLGVLSGGVVDIKATSSGKISIQRSVALKQKREIE